MIDEALIFLKSCLNAYLDSGRGPEDSQEDSVAFLDGDKMDPLTFKANSVSVLLVNIEEETVLRPPDRYVRINAGGSRQNILPDIRLNLYVLFVARYKRYEDSLKSLSFIVQYFQNQPVFDHRSHPDLSGNIEKLLVELVTLPFSEQNEVWNSLRVTYHPSLLYKVRMVVYQTVPQPEAPVVEEKNLNIRS